MTEATALGGPARLEQRAAAYLRLPYARVILPEADGSFRGEIAEFPGCIATGENANEALANLDTVAKSWLESAISRGQQIPVPFESDNDYSGKMMLRIPRSLHKRAAWLAQRDGVSLNQFISTALAAAVGERSVAQSRIYVSSSQQILNVTQLNTIQQTGISVRPSSVTLMEAHTSFEVRPTARPLLAADRSNSVA